MRTLTIAVLLLAVAAGGCVRSIMKEPSADEPAIGSPVARRPSAPAATHPKHPSIITGATGSALLGANVYILGDLDGDGIDDFTADTIDTSADSAPVPAAKTYLFYGRSEFPEEISLADADASFATNSFAPLPLGDITGDGLADFAIFHHEGAYEIVLGSRGRLTGERAARTSGILWVSPVAPGLGVPLAFGIGPAGDVNCDGTADVLVHATRLAATDEEDATTPGGHTVHNDYIVLGANTLPQGDWNPSWAVARFRQSPNDASTFGHLVPSAFGDLDADGCDDLIAYNDDTMAVFYGGKSRFRGPFSPRDADATLKCPSSPQALSDLDGDGAGDIAFSLADGFELQVQYGSRKRWSGNQALAPDLTVSPEGTRRSGGVFAIDSGDIDMDGAPELLIGLKSDVDASASYFTPLEALYAVPGGRARVTGKLALTEAEIVLEGPEVEPPAKGTQSGIWGLSPSLSLAGDVDGDGGRDILSGAPNAFDNGAVFLLPSSARAPE